MDETKGLVKCVLGFLLSILVMVGGAFGLDVQVRVQDTETKPPDVVESVIYETTTEENKQSPAESTPTEDEEPSVEESVDTEVTEPTDEQQNTVTEKGED
jgi:cytoskeletal protein RodZ